VVSSSFFSLMASHYAWAGLRFNLYMGGVDRGRPWLGGCFTAV
jgi:hypothetical protein